MKLIYDNRELKHYGVKGMKWDERKKFGKEVELLEKTRQQRAEQLQNTKPSPTKSISFEEGQRRIAEIKQQRANNDAPKPPIQNNKEVELIEKNQQQHKEQLQNTQASHVNSASHEENKQKLEQIKKQDTKTAMREKRKALLKQQLKELEEEERNEALENKKSAKHIGKQKSETINRKTANVHTNSISTSSIQKNRRAVESAIERQRSIANSKAANAHVNSTQINKKDAASIIKERQRDIYKTNSAKKLNKEDLRKLTSEEYAKYLKSLRSRGRK